LADWEIGYNCCANQSRNKPVGELKMPVLKNAKYELFCQHIASGRDLEEAYADAGFVKGHRGNPSRLRHKTEVDSRITELLSKRARKLLEKDAAEIEYTREVLLAELENARSVAEKAKNGSAMAMATLGKAKILGLIIDRREVGEVGAFDNMTDEELVQEAKKRAAALGLSPDPKLVN
jgi:hypothetical protein